MTESQDFDPASTSASKRSTQTGRGGSAGAGAGSSGSATSRLASEAASQIGEAAQQAASQAKEAVSSLTSLANEQVRSLADRQVSVGADLVAHIADAFRSAADSLDENVPQLSDMARGAADRIEDLSETVRDQSAADLLQATADFARRRPALLFGATALTGFLLFRLFKAGPSEYDAGEFDEFDDGPDQWNDDQLGESEVFAGDESMTPGGIGGDQLHAG